MDLKIVMFTFLVMAAIIGSSSAGKHKKVVIHVPYKVKNIKHTHTVYKTIHHHHGGHGGHSHGGQGGGGGHGGGGHGGGGHGHGGHKHAHEEIEEHEHFHHHGDLHGHHSIMAPQYVLPEFNHMPIALQMYQHQR